MRYSLDEGTDRQEEIAKRVLVGATQDFVQQLASLEPKEAADCETSYTARECCRTGLCLDNSRHPAFSTHSDSHRQEQPGQTEHLESN